jgi:HEAT repeat protein
MLSTKPIYLLLIIFCSFGCKKEIPEIRLDKNPYYDQTKKLSDEAKANPVDKTALHELENYTTNSDSWYRSYALGSLGELAFQNVGDCRTELLPYFDNALKDSDYGVKQSGVQAIYDIGSLAVEKSLPELIEMVTQGKENDITWLAAEALGKLEDSKKSQEISPVLLKAANIAPPEGTPDEAPQIRYYALESIVEIAKKNNLNVVSDLEKLLDESKSPYKERVAKAILELNPTNEAAKKVLNSPAVK